ncbi:helix-turn-helix transcriptional regulator, partial [Dysosmobacter welbionis]
PIPGSGPPARHTGLRRCPVPGSPTGRTGGPDNRYPPHCRSPQSARPPLLPGCTAAETSCPVSADPPLRRPRLPPGAGC